MLTRWFLCATKTWEPLVQSIDTIRLLLKIELKKQTQRSFKAFIYLIPYLLKASALAKLVLSSPFSSLLTIFILLASMSELLSTVGNLIYSPRFCPNFPFSSPHLPSGVLAIHQILPWKVFCMAIDSLEPPVILLCTSPNVPNACELFSRVLWKPRPFLKCFFISAPALHPLWSPQSLDRMLLKFSVHHNDCGESANLNEKTSGKEKKKSIVVIRVAQTAFTGCHTRFFKTILTCLAFPANARILLFCFESNASSLSHPMILLSLQESAQ